MSTISIGQRIWNQHDTQKIREVSWLSVPFFSEAAARSFINEGDEKDLVSYIHKELISGMKRNNNFVGCALACGEMIGERSYFESKYTSFLRVDGIDISDKLLDKAVENCSSASFKFSPVCKDLNSVYLGENMYDLIIGNHGIHHIDNIDFLFKSINRALKPGGLFFCSEYIGPKYLQPPRLNRMLASFFVNLLVWPNRRRITHMGEHKINIKNIDFKVVDPTEAPSSDQIVFSCYKYLSVMKTHFFGGLNYPAFEGIGHHFTVSDDDVELMRKFLKIENLLTRYKIITQLFAFILAKKSVCNKHVNKS